MGLSHALQVRPSRATDAENLIAILYDTFESTWRPNITAAAAQAFRDERRPDVYVAKRGDLFWVCACADLVVGFVDWQDDFINALHVRGAHARGGVGSRLMDKAEHAISNAGFASARLETDTFNQVSQSFYAKRGFIERARYPDTEWRSDLVTILLEKPLR
ncbi:MAG: GNAT family N-acetyltransferase [Alphaproteobacteria bacterium]|nr:GNAT family N-acetyltransferase [Alphaproteobacteria bacterium]